MGSKEVVGAVECSWVVHSCSSESELHAAVNVFREELYRIWQTEEPTDEAWLLVEPHPPVAFNKIEMVNAGSALVEVFGLRADRDGDDETDFEMLLPAQQVMTVRDLMSKSNRYRAFTYDVTHKLTPLAADQRWRCIRVCCRQPLGTDEHKACIGLSRLKFNPCRTKEEITSEAAEIEFQKQMQTELAEMFPNAIRLGGGKVSQVTEPKRVLATCTLSQSMQDDGNRTGFSTNEKKRMLPMWFSSTVQKQGKEASDEKQSCNQEIVQAKLSLDSPVTTSAVDPSRKSGVGTEVNEGAEGLEPKRERLVSEWNTRSKRNEKGKRSEQEDRNRLSDAGNSSESEPKVKCDASGKVTGVKYIKLQASQSQKKELSSDANSSEKIKDEEPRKGQSSDARRETQLDKSRKNKTDLEAGVEITTGFRNREPLTATSTDVDDQAVSKHTVNSSEKIEDEEPRKGQSSDARRETQLNKSRKNKTDIEAGVEIKAGFRNREFLTATSTNVDDQAVSKQTVNSSEKIKDEEARKGQSSDARRESQLDKSRKNKTNLEADVEIKAGFRNREPLTATSTDVDDQAVSRRTGKLKRAKPFCKLLEGVVFTISGLVNPERADLRDKALEMGAKYRPDWSSDCTLLVCVFPNTPKFKQVKGLNGTIVSKDWIPECHRKKNLVEIDPYILHAGKPWKKARVLNTSETKEELDEEQDSFNSTQPSSSGDQKFHKDLVKHCRKTLATVSEVEKWAHEDRAATIIWLEQQEQQPEAEEMETTATQGIILCLEDTIKGLKARKRVRNILENWAFAPRAVQELLACEEEKVGTKRYSRDDLIHEAERLKSIYEAEFRQPKQREDQKAQSLNSRGKQPIKEMEKDHDEYDDDATELISDDGSRDALDCESDETEVMDESWVRQAQESIISQIKG